MNEIDLALKYLEPFINASTSPKEQRLDVFLEPESLKQAIKTLIDQKWGYLIAITGLDIPPKVDDQGKVLEEGKIEGLYHFANGAVVLTLRVKVPYSAPRLESICELIPSATLYEREFIELFGVEISDTPDTNHLILPDCWPEDIYPLRKSFSGLSTDKVLMEGNKENE